MHETTTKRPGRAGKYIRRALLALAAVCLVYNSTAWPYCIVALAFSLAGSLIGAALGRKRNIQPSKRREEDVL